MMRAPFLAVLPTAKIQVLGQDRLVMTRKLFEGLLRYQMLWDGTMTVLIESTTQSSSNLDETEYRWSDLPFRLEVVDFLGPDLARKLAEQDIVLAAMNWNQTHIASLCRALKIPSVYIAEYSLRTRWQIINSEKLSLLRRLVRCVRDLRNEHRFRQASRLAAGVQCNGTPTFQAYGGLNVNPLLYFDTRSEEASFITEHELDERTAALDTAAPLRLLFSGRLIAMKGADHLPRVADELRRLGVPFELRICGGGDLEPVVRRQIAELGLGDQVQLMGVLPYQSELVPMTKRWADLFVCCHRSGDPSCTYLEVMACGVPIVGYANEAFAGVVRHSGVGWATPMAQPRALARKIAALAADRRSLQHAAAEALKFAREHTFERTMETRIRHLQSCLVPQPATTSL